MTNQEDIRFASFNVSLNRSESGELITDLSTLDNTQAQNVAEIIQRNDPDVVLLNEFDYDPQGEGIGLFQENYLGISQNGVDPVEYSYIYSAPSNTGVASGFDLDNDGSTDGPGDAFGFGFYPGQFGMVLLSKYPIVEEDVRTFGNFLWKDMPGALLPDDPTTSEPNDYYSEEELEVFRLSSKSHWDIPIEVDGQIVHVLASHPTPPVFDGEEDRNGRRNHDEIRFWADYITPEKGDYIYDDEGNFGGLAAGESFVIAGDQNADPVDGDSFDNAILQLLDNPLVNISETPDSEGGVAASIRQGGVNNTHEGNPAFDTADFNDEASGNLRVDYVLPSQDLEITNAEVFWTTPEDPLFRLIGDFDPDLQPNGFPASDHRIVFADVQLPEADMDEINNNHDTVTNLDFIGEAGFETGFTFEETETIPTISAVTETPDEIRFGDPESPDPNNAPDADDPAIYVNPDNPEQSFVITTFKDGGLRVYDLAGEEIQSITPGNNVDDSSPFPSPNAVPENIRYNNVDIAYGVEYFGQLVGASQTIDFAVVSDRANDTIAFFAINPETKQLTKWDEGFEFPESIFGVDDGEATAYGLATYNSPVDGKSYVFVSQADGNQIAQLEFSATFGAADEPIVNAKVVRTFEVPVPEGADPEDAQVEGMVVDRETGVLYVAQEEFGIWKYSAEPTVGAFGETPILVDTVTEDTDLSQVPYSNLVVFGDSLSDTGNVFNATEGLIPPSPPYDSGRFSNGDLIVDAIAEELELPESQSFLEGGSNYAFGGAQTGEGSAEFGLLDLPETFDVPNIGQQVDLYLSSQTPTQTDLFYVYGGGNDFIDPLLRGEALPTSEEIVGNITTNITELAEAGGQTFVVPNLPLLGNIPLFLEQPEATAILNNATEEFNQLLDTELDAIASELDVTIIEPDINSIATEIQANPADFGLTNADDAVLDLANLSASGNPEEFFFWDIIHPTATATEIIAQEVIDVLPNRVTQFAGETPSLVPDVEGLTIYYGEDGNGYLVASSQGNNTFAIYDRAGSNSYLGSFAVENVEESDGVDVTNVPLGEDYPAGLLVVQDGSNEPAVVFADPEDGEIQNFNTNFKYVSLADFAEVFPNLPAYDPNAFDPRNPEARTLVNGVASGDTTQVSTVLWTRSLVLGDVTFKYATDPEFKNVVGTVDAEVTDTSVPVKVAIDDLESGTDYYYRVSDAAGDTEVGEFTTSTEVGTYNGFRFGATGDWQQAPPYPSLANADERDLELFVKLGDTIYADSETPALPGVSQARELSDFRTKHSEVITDRVGLNTVSDLYADTSILATIDDHEIVDNFAGGAAPGESPDAPDIGSSDEPLFTDDVEFVNDTEVYENALQAYQEYHPLENKFYDETGEERTANERQLYRSNTYGSDAAVIMLDSRSFRDDQIEPVDLTNPEDTVRFSGEAFDPSRTLLGREQVEDLKADLLAADADGITWKFVTIPEPIQNFGTLNAEDRFEGYAAERNEILQFIDENKIDNVVFMAGDFHGTIVNNLTYQTAPGGEQIATDAFEIVTGPAAFNDGLFGPNVANLSAAAGLITPEQKAFYDSLPVANDTDSEIDDRDDFIKNLLQEQTNLFGYDPVGLNNNLDIADGAIDAELIQGDYVATHTFGWTEFDIDAETQQLKVTTYGVDAYSEEELLENPNAITQLEPAVVSEFVVNPQGGTESNSEFTPVFGTLEADTIEVTGTGNLVFAGEEDDTVNVAEGNNRIYGDGGDDAFFLGTGDYVVGGAGSDQFWVAEVELPNTPIRIADFAFDSDVIGFSNLGVSSEDLTITQNGDDAVIAIAGTEVAVLSGVDANSSFANSFAFA